MLNFLSKLARYVLLPAALVMALSVGIFYFVQTPTELDTDQPVGVVTLSFTDDARARQIDAYIWYPTPAVEGVVLFEDNAVFRGFSAISDAPLEAGSYPLILLSHGSGGNRANQSWLAVELARQGAIVVAANHPGSTSRDSAPATNILAWERPLDISFLIDRLLANPDFAPSIDPTRIATIGHSLGGYTALAIGGAQLSMEQFIDYCDQFPDNPDCVFYSTGGVDLAEVDRTRFEQSLRDNRVSAIVAIDPAFARSMQSESLENLTPTLLIAPEVESNSIDDLQVGYLAESIGLDENFLRLTGAQHFTFLQECKELGVYILSVVERGGGVLCQAEKGQNRTAFHAETAGIVSQFLTLEGILHP